MTSDPDVADFAGGAATSAAAITGHSNIRFMAFPRLRFPPMHLRILGGPRLNEKSSKGFARDVDRRPLSRIVVRSGSGVPSVSSCRQCDRYGHALQSLIAR